MSFLAELLVIFSGQLLRGLHFAKLTRAKNTVQTIFAVKRIAIG